MTMKWKVMCDMFPNTIPGTKGCHKYVLCEAKTKQEAQRIADKIKETTSEKAWVEKNAE